MSSEREMAQCLAQAWGSLAISFFYPVFVTEKGSPVPDNRLFRQPCWLVFPHLPGPLLPPHFHFVLLVPCPLPQQSTVGWVTFVYPHSYL